MIKKISLILTALTILAAPHARAVRPFITDDGNTLEYRQMELATWTHFNEFSGQLWQTCAMALSKRFELSAGAVLGYNKTADDHTEFSYTLPLIQGKYLLNRYTPNKLPGVAIVAGSSLPFGNGAFVPHGYGAFAFLAVTQCFGEDEYVLIHANLGGTYLREERKNHTDLTWGAGTQVKIYKGLHVIAEIVAGDPYIHDTGSAYQAGIRYFLSNVIQLDVAAGNGFGGENKMPFWVSCGIRYVLSFDKSNRGE